MRGRWNEIWVVVIGVAVGGGGGGGFRACIGGGRAIASGGDSVKGKGVGAI